MALEPGTSGRPDLQGSTLRARLLGGLDLRIGDRRLPELDSARAESLLAYLLLHREAPQQRQHLAFTLWPDSTEPQARTNLRHVLHNLRRALPDADRFIGVGQRTLQWRPDAPLWLDVAVFEQAVAEGRLDEAVETYAGELLEGSYDEWLLDERERLGQIHLDALERLAQQLEEQGRLGDAIRYSERLRRQDPLREEAYRALMRLHDASGDRAAALRTYHVCATTLVRELGVEPSAATRGHYEALLTAAAEPEPHEGAPTTFTATPLIGRRVERARLAELWRATERGSAQLVLVNGEPGVGKSRLVEELRSWCAHGGAVIAETRSYPVEGAMAYGALVAWLLSESIASRLDRLERAHLTELARLLPELLSRVQDLAPPEPLPEDEQRQRLFTAAARAILAAGAPLLLVADDLQWCDVQTLQFVHYLLRAEPEARLLVAATARREEIDDHHPVSELVAALQALGAITEVGLERLSREETGLLAERIASKTLDAAEADRLYGDSEGNPLFLIEALRAAPDAAAAPPGHMSEKVRAVITSRLARLSEPAAELVGVAATIGREFTAQVLADASEANEEVLVRGLDELWRGGLVRAQGASAYDFSHGKIREAAYRALSPAKARRHHLRVAHALERAHAGAFGAVSGEIATHYEAAGAAESAIAWHVKAAEAAQGLHASAGAVRSLERALDLALELPAGRERDELELTTLTQLPAPLVAVEGYLSERVAQVHERALSLAGALGTEPEAPLVRSLALANLARGDFDAARGFGERLRDRAQRVEDDVLRVESAYVLGVAAYWQGLLEAARGQFETAIERSRPEQRAAHLLHYGQDPEVFCLTRLAHTLWLLGRGDEAERARDAGLALAEQRGHRYSLAVASLWAAILALDQRDEDRLRAHARALDSTDPTAGAPQIRMAASALVGVVDVLDGRSQAGIARIRGARDDAGRGEPIAPGIHTIFMRILLEAYATAGEARLGLEAADEALAMGGGAQLWEAEVRRLRAEFLAALDAGPQELEAELGRAVAVAERQGARSIERRAREDLARIRAGTL
jgi:DNA-binding SARP family transcriptional activator/tetratricopeptide (TPR) repeat protein